MSEGEGRTCISIMDAELEASDESQERTKEDTEFKSERCTAVRIVGAWRVFALAPPGRSRYDWLRQADTGPMPRIDDADNRFASRKSNASGKSGPFPFRTLVRGACKCTSPLIFGIGPTRASQENLRRGFLSALGAPPPTSRRAGDSTYGSHRQKKPGQKKANRLPRG